MDTREPSHTTPALDDELALRSGGQRRISLLWEMTQAAIAVMTVGTALWCCWWMIKTDKGSDSAFMLVGNVAILVVNMYFTRTNHTKVGGPGGESAGRR